MAFLGVIQGIFIAVGLALLNFIWRAWRPYFAVLGKVDGLKGYHDVTRYPTVGAAVDAYVAETGVEWREEDSEPNADPEGR